ncbi:MAG: hypothetical protein KDA83_12310 [Planctomycetales bacterium]|nr:hypothetical protein [Planctomycetales bacterium]
MSAIASNASNSAQLGEISRSFANVTSDDFLQLIITELQNQDPLEPTSNSEFLQQITQIREISASDKLTETLDQVLAGQNLTMASGLIGREVIGVDDLNEEVQGVVDRVALEANAEGTSKNLRVYIGDQSFAIDRIREINAASAAE